MSEQLLPQGRLIELVLLSFDGKISEEQFKTLESQIVNYQEACDLYFKLLVVYTGLSDYNNDGISLKESCNDSGGLPAKYLNKLVESEEKPENWPGQQVWQELLKYEKAAPTIEIPKEKQVLPKTVSPPRTKQKLSKFAIFTFINAAAVILFFLFLRFAPDNSVAEVASVTSILNAKLSIQDTLIKPDSRLMAGKDILVLDKGIVELAFDNNATVLLEGPAEFQILAEDRIGLNYGKVYSTVPEEAIGFSIYTQNAKIIDMGTEFGVEASIHGETQLHVLKGKTMLMAGEKANKVNVEVCAGKAQRISEVDNSVSEIECDQTKFARMICGRGGQRIWRGESISLASIVAGFDGFQDVYSLKGLDPATGEYTTSSIMDARVSKTAYNPVSKSPFIDGVFVPDGGRGPVLITSLGDTFDCPNTSGLFTHEISVYKDIPHQNDTTIPRIVSGGVSYDRGDVVMLHSNVGITFDLRAFRQNMPELKLTSFKSSATLTEILGDSKEDLPDIDFWVLVDGQIRYEHKLLKTDSGLIDFDIKLNSQDKFLTLIVTDGLRKGDGRREFAYGNDFFYLINPELKLESQY